MNVAVAIKEPSISQLLLAGFKKCCQVGFIRLDLCCKIHAQVIS